MLPDPVTSCLRDLSKPAGLSSDQRATLEFNKAEF